MLIWVARICAVGAWAALATASVRAFALGGGAVQPLTGLLALGWTGVGLLWIRALALWAGKAVRVRQRARAWKRRVSLAKEDARPRRCTDRVPEDFSAAPWVFVRQAAVWILLPLVMAVPGALDEMDGGEAVRELKSAGAAIVTATVVETVDFEEAEDADGNVTHYHGDLVLVLPDGRRITAWGADTREEPKPDDRVQALWAPSAPQLGALVKETLHLERHVEKGWTVGGQRIFLLCFFAVFCAAFVVVAALVTGAEGLHDLAWRPLAQTVLPAVATLLLLWIRPALTGAGMTNGALESAAYGGFAIVLLLQYLGLTLRAFARAI
ncbi:hypothetical protein ACGFZP_21085 [Kitasatospora sp. NPDC048239]|uniref:hypothetical protein n=1 Tax=Kitasatospora sp. NPDC048239 TaxID=3364046 RepID=UPI00371B6F4B